MHRNRSRLATRVPGRVQPYATALERRGIVATYELHDRLLSNRASRRRFARHHPVLNDVQRRIVAGLEAEGYAITTFEELVGDDRLREEIERQAAQFIEKTEDALAREQTGDADPSLRRRAGKEFVVRRLSYGVEVGLDDPWLRAATSSRLLDIANAYLHLWSKLEYVDSWYSVPQREGADRVASQLWHFDYDDKHLLKAFLYLVDVDAEAGPFEYVPGSQPGGPLADIWPWKPMAGGRVSEEKVSARVPPEGVKTFTGPRGTMIFCNTSGLHRGGFTTAKPRVLSTATYCSPASLAALSERNFRVTGVPAGGGLSPEASYALS